MPVQADIKELLAAGAHFGHKTSRWHPKMAPYIHSKREGAHIINLEKTVEALDVALPELTKLAAKGKKILFVGTKKQLKDSVKEAAESVDMPYVTVRWVGGMLTNVETVTKQIRKLKDLERRMASGELEKRYNKLEVQRYQEEIDLLNERYGGIKEMAEQPVAVRTRTLSRKLIRLTSLFSQSAILTRTQARLHSQSQLTTTLSSPSNLFSITSPLPSKKARPRLQNN